MRLNVYGFAAFVGVMTVAGVVATAQTGVQVFRVRDDCDPATFNSGPPDGPGAGVICNTAFDGDTTFAEFIQELTEDQQVGHWRFQPEEKELDRGMATVLDSRRSGEFHTFTRVAEFGGGILPDLNELSHAGETRPECGTPGVLAPPSATNNFLPDGSVVSGPSAGSAAMPRGTTKWQCCIHPWMRSEVKVRNR
jgi:hypothetical protein